MPPVSLVLFDCDGTLVDSQALIVDCVALAFDELGLEPPTKDAARSIIGLSLPVALAQLSNSPDDVLNSRLVDSYIKAFHAKRASGDFEEPMFEGARAVIDALHAANIDMGVVTGKSRRGLNSVIAHHRLEGRFVTLHTGDVHPSKPHPAMVHAALLDAGAEPAETLVIGDTTFDIDMAIAAGCRAIGVDWGYHPNQALTSAGAETVLERFDQLLPIVSQEFHP